MSGYETTSLTQGYRSWCEDRIEVFNTNESTIIVVADGAGGSGGGATAAECVVRAVKESIASKPPFEWEGLLRQIDMSIGEGESTAVVVELSHDTLRGASVGDSCAWIIEGDRLSDLTKLQQRKPLLGSREAAPIAFAADALTGTLLVATDGFCNYVKQADLTRLVARADFFELPRRCLDSVRLPSGDLWDDVGIVVARPRRTPRTRQRYSL